MTFHAALAVPLVAALVTAVAGDTPDPVLTGLLAEAQERNPDIRAAVVREPSPEIRAVSRVTVDERRVHHIHAVYVDFTGKFVRRGQPLASVFSPTSDLLRAVVGPYRGAADRPGAMAAASPSPTSRVGARR